MPDDDRVRSLLRDHWHLPTIEVRRITGGMLSQAWDVAAGGSRYVARLVDPAGRQALEAGLAAAVQLRGSDVEAGQPVRTLAGSLSAATPAGVLALLHRVSGRALVGSDPVDQQFWGDRLGALHRTLQGFHHPGLRPWNLLDPDAAHLAVEPWLRPAVTDAVTATTKLTVTDRLTYGVLHGDPAAEDFVVDPATGRAGLLDCGAGGSGPLAYDVAAAVVYAGGMHCAAELLDGYVAAGPLSQDELDAALPVLLRFRWAVQADWAARQLAAGGGRDGPRERLYQARQALGRWSDISRGGGEAAGRSAR